VAGCGTSSRALVIDVRLPVRAPSEATLELPPPPSSRRRQTKQTRRRGPRIKPVISRRRPSPDSICVLRQSRCGTSHARHACYRAAAITQPVVVRDAGPAHPCCCCWCCWMNVTPWFIISPDLSLDLQTPANS